MSKEFPYKVTTSHVDGGVDVTIEATDNMKIDLIDQPSEQGARVTLHLRDYTVPREGSRVMVGGKAVKVKARRYDQSGNLWVLDEDTGVWVGM